MFIRRATSHHKMQVVNSDDIIEYGYEKALIISNIDKYCLIDKENIPEYFPYMKKDEFETHVKQLIEIGVLCIEDEPGEPVMTKE